MAPSDDELTRWVAGTKIVLLRRLRRWNQAVLAEAADMDPSQISRYETGDELPRSQTGACVSRVTPGSSSGMLGASPIPSLPPTRRSQKDGDSGRRVRIRKGSSTRATSSTWRPLCDEKSAASVRRSTFTRKERLRMRQ